MSRQANVAAALLCLAALLWLQGGLIADELIVDAPGVHCVMLVETGQALTKEQSATIGSQIIEDAVGSGYRQFRTTDTAASIPRRVPTRGGATEIATPTSLADSERRSRSCELWTATGPWYRP